MVSIENLKILKCHSSSGKAIICSKYENGDDKVFKEKESIQILKILGLIENISLL